MKYEENEPLRGLIRAIGKYLGENCEYGALDELMGDITHDIHMAYIKAEMEVRSKKGE